MSSFFILIVSLLGSLTIVLIFRNLDRNNRSFEKIARLSKTIKNELSEFAQERYQELKDFDNCVEVSFQKGSSVLEKINKSINSVEQRFDFIEKEKEKISIFYKKIDMIDKEIVDINSQMNEMNNSKKFVESIDNKLSIFKKNLAFIERDMHRIQDNFNKQNTIALKSASEKRWLTSLSAGILPDEPNSERYENAGAQKSLCL